MRKFFDVMLVTVAAFYVSLLLWVVFFARDERRSINVIPFDMIQQQGFTLNVWGNILMFVPLGIYVLFMMKKRNMLVAIFYTLLCSVAIEVIQFVFARGSSDIDDVLLNTFGGVIGIIIFRLISVIWRQRLKQQLVLAIMSTIVGVPMILLTTILRLAN